MPIFLTVGPRAGSRGGRGGGGSGTGGGTGPGTFPFDTVDIYDATSALTGLVHVTKDRATGRLLFVPVPGGEPRSGPPILIATFDLSGASVISVGGVATLNSTVSTTVLARGFPNLARFRLGATIIADLTPIPTLATVTDANQQVVYDTTPDTTVHTPGQWDPGVPVAFGPGDIRYQP